MGVILFIWRGRGYRMKHRMCYVLHVFLMMCAVFLLKVPEAFSIEYRYDELSRLVEVRYDNGASVTYEYDAAGNIVHVEKTPARFEPEPGPPSDGGSGGGGGGMPGPGDPPEDSMLIVPERVDLGASDIWTRFEIRNGTGYGKLLWSIGEVNYNQADGWICAIGPKTGTTTGSSTVTLSVDRSGLSAGIYTADIPVTSNAGSGRVAVLIEVMEGENQAPPSPEQECEQDRDCDDGVFCNGKELCSDGLCTDGEPPCGDDQVCMEEEQVCWGIETLTAMSLKSSYGRPIVRTRRCPWLVMKCSQEDHVNSESSMELSGPAENASGVVIDESRKPLKALGFILLPLCITKNAAPGQWELRIETQVAETRDPNIEIIRHRFEIK